ncbi:MAG: hypothetical protein M3350_08725 [Actinomycetota bacterium]|nr:hypothetical protein [Actinomycetota bacterium]MDQ3720845.1 hypothetical protein [Actinomycetota bacterium]
MTANENDVTQPQGVAPPAHPAQTDAPDQLRDQIGQTGGGPGDTGGSPSDKSDVKAQAQAKVDEVREKVANVSGDDLKQVAATAKAQAESNPLNAIAGAVVAGFILGRLTKRS